MSRRKVKVIFYKKGCTPRLFVNPCEELLVDLRKEGEVLINPNTSSVKGMPLAWTYPDTANNMVRPLPEGERPKVDVLNNPIRSIKRDRDIDLEKNIRKIKAYDIERVNYKKKVDRGLRLLNNKINDSIILLLSETVTLAEDIKEYRLKRIKEERKLLLLMVLLPLSYMAIYHNRVDLLLLLQELTS